MKAKYKFVPLSQFEIDRILKYSDEDFSELHNELYALSQELTGVKKHLAILLERKKRLEAIEKVLLKEQLVEEGEFIDWYLPTSVWGRELEDE